MKYLTLWAKTEEQKADQTMQLKLIQAWAVMFITSAICIIADISFFGKLTDPSKAEAIFFAVITINFITFVPMILRSSWKIILPRLIGSTLLATIVLLVFDKFI